MQDEKDLSPPLQELEAGLSACRPAAPALTSNRLMFHAGQAAARRSNRLWKSLTVMLAAGLAASFLWRPTPQATIPTQYIAEKPATLRTFTTPARLPERYPSEGISYLRLRNNVLTHGLDALPESHLSPALAEPMGSRQQFWKNYQTRSGKRPPQKTGP